MTAEDYKVILPKLYQNVDSVSMGGEDNDPPVYGKVFLAIKPKTGKDVDNFNKECYQANLSCR